MPCLSAILRKHDVCLQAPVDELHQATTLFDLVRAVWVVVRLVAVCLLEERLGTLAESPAPWPLCTRCGRRLRSHGFRARQLIAFCCVIQGAAFLVSSGFKKFGTENPHD